MLTALKVVVAALLVAGLYWLIPKEKRSLAQKGSLAAALAFLLHRVANEIDRETQRKTPPE